MSKGDILKEMEYKERVDLSLRNLYREYGYSRFKMGKFEEYDLYTRNKNFIPSEDIITVTGNKGKLLALRPDLTLSIVKYYRPDEKRNEKLYYSENIYRSARDGEYRELRQTGLERLGNIGKKETEEVVFLAALSLKEISKNFILDISHMGIIQEVLAPVPDDAKKDFLKAIEDKNIVAINEIACQWNLNDEVTVRIEALASLYGNYKTVLPKLRKLCVGKSFTGYIDEISDVCEMLSKSKLGRRINIDFSIVNNMTYYSGILFKGYIPGIPQGILSGGRYDGVMKHMGKSGGAIGFALYLDSLEAMEDESSVTSYDEYINIALPKGRLGKSIYALFEKAGYPCKGIKEDNRRLVFENKTKKIRYFWVKPSDVTVYVERGTADIGACGKDIIEEYQADVYELLDLKKGACKLCVASKKDFRDDTSKTLRVATKFPEIARSYYEKESRSIDIIELHGSIELAPVLDLSDVIVDIVETGKTLKENDLVVREEIMPISARLISNKSSFKFKTERINAILKGLQENE